MHASPIGCPCHCARGSVTHDPKYIGQRRRATIFLLTSFASLRPKSITPVSLQQVRNKSVTSWRGQKSVVSVVSCRFPNSIATTCCCQLDSLPTSWQLPHLYGKLRRNVSSGFRALVPRYSVWGWSSADCKYRRSRIQMRMLCFEIKIQFSWNSTTKQCNNVFIAFRDEDKPTRVASNIGVILVQYSGQYINATLGSIMVRLYGTTE